MLHGRGGGSKSRIRVAGLVRAPGAKKACKKHVKPYNRTRFASPKGTSKSAPGMRFIIGFYILYVFCQNLVAVVKIEKCHTTVRFGPLKAVLVKGAGVGAVIRFYNLYNFSRKRAKS